MNPGCQKFGSQNDCRNSFEEEVDRIIAVILTAATFIEYLPNAGCFLIGVTQMVSFYPYNTFIR